ncbi:M57 family metalloprotease [Flavobacterium subsaxonicum]|uniref:Uncharacterized protein n=1 Tax=Flavobacterium subsaxonicum WB 4.1-42 = DSM 21790 TaxID=1121898 RepID=A0A0A2MVI7_9FLAO|nr:M57 family metalloprotease [Flavobacterium subsaxonicum]KGO92220.1 hypothetical protein Q766_13750 [Flavobacterium subsaxonicum WB 4.1-42 = DSM 21790]
MEALNNGQKANIDAKYQCQLDKKRKDFATRAEFKDYKTSVKNYKKSTEKLADSRVKEQQIFDAINNFAATDENNYNLVNNLEFKDSKGDTQCVDVVINAGVASGSGGGATAAKWTQNADGTYQGMSSIMTTLDFRIVDPISNVLAHEMGHAYGMTINPIDKFKFYTSGKVTQHDCQLPENRHHFRSESAMNFQESYDSNKRRKPGK